MYNVQYIQHCIGICILFGRPGKKIKPSFVCWVMTGVVAGRGPMNQWHGRNNGAPTAGEIKHVQSRPSARTGGRQVHTQRPGWRTSDSAPMSTSRYTPCLGFWMPGLSTQRYEGCLFTPLCPLGVLIFSLCVPLPLINRKTHKDGISEKKQLLRLYLGTRPVILTYMLFFSPSDDLAWLEE